MQTGSATSQPIGHYEFCQKYKSECNVRSKGTVAPRVTERGWAAIRQVNAAVNREITPVTDLELHGRDEVWSYPDNAGDCEDFVLEKRKRLMRAARHYLVRHGGDQPCRFDVVLVRGAEQRIEWLPGALDA